MHYNIHTVTESLYIHWPFCPYKCHFCPFVALASHDQFMEQYHAALMSEIKQFSVAQMVRAPIKTIHCGGGTPSTYPPHLLRELFTILDDNFCIELGAEKAFEVNPGTVSDEKINTWRNVGINRLSIGVQSVNDRVLQSLNRHQTASQVFGLLDKVAPFFDNISIDLILGLPGISGDDWCALIEQVMGWPIKHISIYFLTVHENTPLYFKVQANQVTLPADDDIVSLYAYTCDILAQHGFEQYELSNFARPGYASRHNTAYWNRVPYKGFGIGACSFDGFVRFQNEKNIMRYMNLSERKEAVTTFFEELTENQVWLETVMLSMRRPQGVAAAFLSAGLAEDALTQQLSTIERFVRDGYIEYQGAHVRLTQRGLAVENEILAQLAHI